jgi:hypothetical protein
MREVWRDRCKDSAKFSSVTVSLSCPAPHIDDTFHTNAMIKEKEE